MLRYWVSYPMQTEIDKSIYLRRALALGGIERPILSRTERGKPYLPGTPSVQFSVSHSGGYYVCAVGDRAIGIDLQRHTDCRRIALARRFFHPDEATYLEQTDGADFFRIWAAKESFVKCTGDGIAHRFRAFSVIREGRIVAPDGYTLTELPFLPGYTLFLCELTARTEKSDLL